MRLEIALVLTALAPAYFVAAQQPTSSTRHPLPPNTRRSPSQSPTSPSFFPAITTSASLITARIWTALSRSA
jgi:hypothetical protein